MFNNIPMSMSNSKWCFRLSRNRFHSFHHHHTRGTHQHVNTHTHTQSLSHSRRCMSFIFSFARCRLSISLDSYRLPTTLCHCATGAVNVGSYEHWETKQNWIKMSWWQKAFEHQIGTWSKMAIIHNTQYLSALNPCEYKVEYYIYYIFYMAALSSIGAISQLCLLF